MKKALKIIAVTIIFTLVFGIVGANAAKSKVIENDLFYIEIPEDYTQNNEYTPNYYFENENLTSVEFYVEANFQFPEGIKETDDDVIMKRAEFIIRSENPYVKADDITKTTLNGFNVALITGMDQNVFENPFSAYVLATEETVFVIYCVGSIDDTTKELEKITDTFTVNGTYFDGDEPTIDHDFQGAEDYYSSHEKDIEEYYALDSSEDQTIGIIVTVVFILAFICPICLILSVIFIVFHVKNKKKLREYERLAGSLDLLRNNPQTYGMGMYGTPYNQGYIPQQPPFGAPMGYNAPIWREAPTVQPENAQNEIPVPTTEIETKNNENKEI